MADQTQARAAADDRPILPRRQPPRRGWSRLLLFVACALLVNGLVGERGLTEMLRARRAYDSVVADITRLRRENRALRSEAERLRSDPGAIEGIARQDLGLARPGELVFTIHELHR